MKSESSLVWRGARPLIGSMMGVGLFGLPFAVNQFGFFGGMLTFLVVMFLTATIAFLYAELVLVRGGKARFIHVVRRELGHWGTFVAGTAFLGGGYGALLAYCLFGGEFLQIVLWRVLPLTTSQAIMVFLMLAALATVGGMLAVARIQRIMLPVIGGAMLFLACIALPRMEWKYLLTTSWGDVGAAVGVMAFATFGFGVIPESRDLLGGAKALLPKSIARAEWTMFFLYTLFIGTVIGISGTETPENALTAFKEILGRTPFAIASALALLVTLSAFMNVASSITQTYLNDFRLRFFPSWGLTMSVPIVCLLLGASSIIGVLSITGGVLGSITAIMVIIAYERARISAELPKHSLRMPQWIVALAFILFAGLIIVTLA